MNPDERVPGLGGVIEDLSKLPKNIEIPSGVERNNKWYAQFYTTRDGRVFYEFYRRGNTGRPGTETPDPVYATVQGPTNTEQADRFRKEQEQAAKPPPGRLPVGTTRQINGIPHTVTGYDEQGVPIWAPAQTTQGPAQPSSSSSSSAVPGNAVPRVEGTPDPSSPTGFNNDQPIMVWRTPDGTQVDARPLTEAERARWEREQGRTPAAETKPDRKQVTGSDGKVYTVVTELGPNGTPTTTVYAPDGTMAPGNVVPGAAKDDKQPSSASATEPLKGHPGWKVGKRVKKDGQGNEVSETFYINPQGQETATPPDEPAKPTEIREIDGEPHEIIRDPKSGRVIETRPIQQPRSGTGAGPRLPALIVGQSEAAIRAYHNQLGEEVAAGRMTPAQRANRLQEAFQVANIAMTEAQLAQRQLESARSTGFNIASTRLDYFGNGFTNAIKFVNDLNGKLPPGSSLGGDAFVAMLTMQMAIAQRSGIMDLEIPDEALTPEARARRQQQRANLPTPRLTDPTNPTKVAEDRERAIADPIFRPAPPVSAEEASAAVQSAQPEAAPAPALPEPIFRPAPPVDAPPAAQAAAPTPSAPAVPPAPSRPMPPPPAPLPTAPADMLGDPPPVPNAAPGMMSPNPQDINEWNPPFNPAPGSPGHRPGEPVGQTPDFPVLANLRVPMPVQQPVPFESPAMLRSIAASTPPWRLSNDQIEQMLAMGIDEDTIFSVPRPRVGVGA